MVEISAPSLELFPHSKWYLKSLLDKLKSDYLIIYPFYSKYNFLKFLSNSNFFCTIYCILKSNNKTLLVLDGNPIATVIASYIFKKNIYLTVTSDPDYYFYGFFKFFKFFLKCNFINKNTTLLIRTKKIEKQWIKLNFNTFEYKSWELSRSEFYKKKFFFYDYCIVGQLRDSKKIDFFYNKLKSRLIISGTCHPKFIPNFPYISNPSEDEFLNLINSSKFIIAYYFNGNLEQESGILYQAMIAKTPIIARDSGWLGYMVRKYSIGLLFNDLSIKTNFPFEADNLDSSKYNKMIKNIERARELIFSESILYLNKLEKVINS